MPNIKYQISNTAKQSCYAPFNVWGDRQLLMRKRIRLQSGFTLMELMVVLTISALLFTGLIINVNGQRAPRDIKIAQSQLVSNIRKAESYTLSSRNMPSGQPAQYYVVKFDLANPTKYTIQGIFNVNTAPQVQDVETIQLPVNVKISAISISGRLQSPANQTINSLTGCALVAFVAPYGKVLFNSGCSPVTFPSNPYTIVASPSPDDYSKLVTFQTNVACAFEIPPNPASCSASTDSVMTITLTNSANASLQNHVIINSITGGVSFD